MAFHQRRPAPPLDALVETLWDWDMPPAPQQYERVLPQPGAQLIINLYEDQTRTYTDDAERRCLRASGSVLGGPQRCSQIIDTAEQIRVMGAVFRPGGAGALTGEDMGALDGRDVDLAGLFGHHATELRQRLLETPRPGHRLALLERWLQARVRLPRLEPCVAHALAWLERSPQAVRIGWLVRETGVSERRLGRLFRRQVGYGPKPYARLLRFRAVVAQAHGRPQVDWAGLAADGGYCDQAHLAHEFRRFAGITPGTFMTQQGPHLNHLALD
ncbi:helix-turn-helix domain-containing protein [Frateuria sp. STR12]|uniref:helix-turn-helix domain-containing protein n=1 Tax=Frateuria hangzhouensis TaxID=2995589 RepID=UPI002260EE94|nr:helix-turn-helix domain-containing protein [Frateuria sp. STR12]MCX7512300.1 helix-turn-helix domain-containing protein [Frateuria sp. STR12]